jgi:hypothetical protein
LTDICFHGRDTNLNRELIIMHRNLIAMACLATASIAVAQTAPVAPTDPVAATAPVAATPATPATPAAAPLPTDRRDAVVQVCMAEAKTRATTAGAVDVTLRKVEDTDLTSDGNASMRASVNLVTKDDKGKVKSKKKTFGCQTRNNVVVGFDYDG